MAVLVAAATAQESSAETALDVAQEVYDDCLQRGSLTCVRPRVLAFLAAAKQRDDKAIRITRDLAIVPSGDSNALDAEDLQDAVQDDAVVGDRHDSLRQLLLQRVDAVQRFLVQHDVRMAVPRELADVVPAAVRAALPAELRLPLDPDREDGARHRKRRGFLKKVVLPFILGLKFKTTVLIPLALSLIALKTWKALTLGLLSLVLSGAMVIFRFTKPKVVNYDVYHYPQHGHHDHHVDHHVDHHAGYEHAHYDHYAAARSARSAADLAYSAHQP
ncbi:uncharacterized protein LOC117653240, partial [Thrips palmi]|uniref:Uncharacterized protein LOC117653240 n=1 Tax=Thrips palmi TaxID=161013 RepID=A0A6P9AB16_THRPL